MQFLCLALRLNEDFGGFMIMRLSDVEAEVETRFGGKEIRRFSKLKIIYCH
jgi:hypothetical protein